MRTICSLYLVCVYVVVVIVVVVIVVVVAAVVVVVVNVQHVCLQTKGFHWAYTLHAQEILRHSHMLTLIVHNKLYSCIAKYSLHTNHVEDD